MAVVDSDGALSTVVSYCIAQRNVMLVGQRGSRLGCPNRLPVTMHDACLTLPNINIPRYLQGTRHVRTSAELRPLLSRYFNHHSDPL